MDKEIGKNIEILAAYTRETDLRTIALQQALVEFLKLTPKQKTKLEKLIEAHYQSLLQVSSEEIEDIDPALAARLLDGKNPYAKE